MKGKMWIVIVYWRFTMLENHRFHDKSVPMEHMYYQALPDIPDDT